jgi:hypothetical protein
MARTFATAPPITLPLRTTWQETWQLLQEEDGPPVDLSGYEARMQVRDPLDDGLVIELSTTDGRLTIDGPEGLILLRVEASDVDAMSPSNERRRLRWDCELYIPEVFAPTPAPEYVIPLFTGSLSLTPRWTRP